MKKHALTILLVVCTLLTFAQVPQAINTQMVLRDAGGAPMPSETVMLRYTMLQDSLAGTPIYQETHQTTSNQFGLINTILGEGTVVYGDFTAIRWYDGGHYLMQELDMQDGNGFLEMGTTQLISVPYALTAGSLVLQSPDGTPYHIEVDNTGVLVTVPHLAPVAGFTADTLSGEAPLTVSFLDTSLYEPISWQWDFGDGSTSSDVNPVYEYTTAGDYTVSLTASNAYGMDSETKVNYIVVTSSGGSCPPTVTDFDGNSYNTVLIGDQCWMKENLKVTHYPNGDAIPYITDNSAWGALGDNNTDDAYCYYNNNTGSEYGALYSYAASIADNWTRDNSSGQGICPAGWHLPTDAEWTILSDYLGGSSVAGGKMKESGTSHWYTPNTGATNESGFTALPGGVRSGDDGTFSYASYGGTWWSATEYSSNYGWRRGLGYGYAYVNRYYDFMSCGFSVRCIRD